MHETIISFLFRRHIGFSGSREDRKCVQSCNLTSIHSPLFVFLWNTVCGHTRLKIVSSAYFNVEIFRRIASSVKRLRILVFKSSCQHFTQFGKYGLQPRV